MIGVWSQHASTFLLVTAVLSTAVFALPLFLAPLRWASVFGWRVPEQTDLAVYFGRCLGAVALVIQVFIARAALTGVGASFAFQLILASAVLMVVVHVWGALRRIQPVSETWEIGFWAGLFLLAVLFYPGG